ncbi:hypothetical protein H6G76_11635 [Nostoc sp. FACHB-152]|uniref:hypothetical protein n=1 Tax=unclassified Nostoc TaxID=2593658 RepID=UPI0016851593|nr:MULTISPECIES: hypothetical protein [unclassified Nostoc]MBD2447816.1 hypothetical protein [Nostoc sp. FACHB-152]MBD2468610.1 hypothetical protein [Nostoc sp. FACHB-145]
MPQKINSNSRNFSKVGTIVFYFLAVIAILAAAFPWLYEIKTKAGINISDRYHAGTFFEKHTHGIFRCEWLYPYKCDRPKGDT